MISNISGSYKKIFRKSFMYKSCFGINIIKKNVWEYVSFSI